MGNVPHCGGRGRFHRGSFRNGYGLREHARTLDHHEAFDCAGEYSPCAVLSVKGPIGMALPAAIPRPEGPTKRLSSSRRIEGDSERSENDTNLSTVKRDAIVESLGCDSGRMIRRNRPVRSPRQQPGLLSVHLPEEHPPSSRSQVLPTFHALGVCRTHETNEISRRP